MLKTMISHMLDFCSLIYEIAIIVDIAYIAC